MPAAPRGRAYPYPFPYPYPHPEPTPHPQKVVEDPFVLLFCNCLAEQDQTVDLDRWVGHYADRRGPAAIEEACKLRGHMLRGLKRALYERNLSKFPYHVVHPTVPYDDPIPCIPSTPSTNSIPTTPGTNSIPTTPSTNSIPSTPKYQQYPHHP